MTSADWIKLSSLVLIVGMIHISGSVDFMRTTDTNFATGNVKGKNWNASSCPLPCFCHRGTMSFTSNEIKLMNIVNCTLMRLENLPENLPKETEVFLASQNVLAHFTKLPHLPELIYLDLSYSSLEEFKSTDAFSQVKELKYLDLKGNKLSYLQEYAFCDLQELHYLDLSNNKLQNITEKAFNGLQHLQSLNLANNFITEIDPRWFSETQDLRELDLSNNLIDAIDGGSFLRFSALNLLNLSSNQIETVNQNTFINLTHMLILDISYNKIQFVPTQALQTIKSLLKVNLDGNNVHKIHLGDFSDMNVAYISISFLPDLMYIEKSSFQNLPHLVTLDAHNNKKLIYIDAQSFENVPRLKTLLLHNNHLTALSPKLAEYVPSLELIHFYHNPLQCDCNAFWIRELVQEANTTNHSKPLFTDAQFLKCDYPLNFTGMSIEEIPESAFDRVCAPTTLPAFQEKYMLDLGEELRLECHVFGVPQPKLSWLFPNQTNLSGNIHDDKFEIIDDCVLIIRYLTPADSGTYACKADNGIGVDLSSTKIEVTNKPVRLVLYTISSDFVSLSWNGTKHSTMISDYQLHFHEIKEDNSKNFSNQNIKYKVISLGPKYKSYTVTNLKPKTMYEFCIIYVYDTELYKVDCRRVKTLDKVEYHSAIKKIVSEKIIAGVCTALGLVLAIACMVTLVKKFRLHKEYESPYNTDDTESINIPLENVYHPTTTMMCSSKTSLLSGQSLKSGFDDY